MSGTFTEEFSARSRSVHGGRLRSRRARHRTRLVERFHFQPVRARTPRRLHAQLCKVRRSESHVSLWDLRGGNHSAMRQPSQTSSINSQSLLPSHAYLLTTPPARLHSHLSAGLAYHAPTSPSTAPSLSPVGALSRTLGSRCFRAVALTIALLWRVRYRQAFDILNSGRGDRRRGLWSG